MMNSGAVREGVQERAGGHLDAVGGALVAHSKALAHDEGGGARER